jgi:endoglucanase
VKTAPVARWTTVVLAAGVAAGSLGADVPAPVPVGAGAAAVQLNQVGFLPGAAKWAVLPAQAPERFTIVEADSGREVLPARARPPATWAPAQAAVRLAEFTALTRPGRYRLRVAGWPDSDAFAVTDAAYAALNAAAIKAFYFNRAGSPLLAAHAGVYARAAGHPDDQVRVHASAAGPGRPEGTIISSPKGWYDAGDYNKYIVNSGISVYTLLAAWEQFPGFFRSQQLGIPESGNGLPDLLNEVLWNLDWMLTMQDPADGGVYHKLTNQAFDGTVMPHQARAERFVVQKTTAAALNFAAVMAQASRVFSAFEAQRPGYAARTLAAARAAWRWAQANPAVVYRQPPDIRTGEYGDAKLDDEFAWAAAELYISTRDDVFYAAMKPSDMPNRVPSWGDTAGLAWMSLAQHRERLTPAADPALIRQRIHGLAAELSARWQASA